MARVGMTKLQRKRVVSGGLPWVIRQHYTDGQAASLAVIARVARREGSCRLSLDRIGTLAGVGRTTVQTAVSLAAHLGHISVRHRQEEGDTNVIKVDFEAWDAMMAISEGEW